MRRTYSVNSWKEELRKNYETLQRLLSSEDMIFPALQKRLKGYNASLGRKLGNLLQYAIAYGTEDDRQFISRDDGCRGYEFACSFEMMTRLYKGSCETWSRSVLTLSALGLIYQHKPDMHDEGYNTPAQQYSVERAAQRSEETGRKMHPVTWYSFPRYTDRVLREAEGRAQQLSSVSTGRINKDSIRDKLGSDRANIAADTPFRMRESTQDLREVLKDIAASMIEQDGYTTEQAIKRTARKKLLPVIEIPDGQDLFSLSDDIAKAMVRVGYEEKNIERALKAYLPQMLEECGWKNSRPTTEERERLGLTSWAWIIR